MQIKAIDFMWEFAATHIRFDFLDSWLCPLWNHVTYGVPWTHLALDSVSSTVCKSTPLTFLREFSTTNRREEENGSPLQCFSIKTTLSHHHWPLQAQHISKCGLVRQCHDS
jgi:hypothetical protein